MAVILTYAFTFISRQYFFSRLVLVFAFPAAAIAVATWHTLARSIARKSAGRRGVSTRVAVYGLGETAVELADYLENSAPMPYSVVGYIKPGESSEEDAGPEASCTRDDMQDWLQSQNVEELVVADTTLSREELAGLIYFCEQNGIAYKLVADVFALISLTARVTQMGSTTLVESVPLPLSGTRAAMKRLMDVVFSFLLLVLFIPLFALIAVAIIIDSGLPVFYSQTRLGRHNREFRILKFRSMRKGADEERNALLHKSETNGPLFRMKKDPRVTRVGRLLRRWSLDELPQLLNVLRGDMSLVGPRPHMPSEAGMDEGSHLKRLEMIPGITGVSQVSGRCDLDFAQMIKLDLYYVDNWSVWLDLAILVLTVPALLSREGAY
jgi:exopolysaccharide biosynthesis polyprenyl glycosylphosphotransferase